MINQQQISDAYVSIRKIKDILCDNYPEENEEIVHLLDFMENVQDMVHEVQTLLHAYNASSLDEVTSHVS